MKDELKTLKDIMEGIYDNPDYICASDFEDIIKAEAIKWVKKANKKEIECLDKEDFRNASFHNGFASGLKIVNNICASDFEDIIKAEAIKWVKEGIVLGSADAWVKHFFNITEEDLKGGI